eukprot:Pgem_evm1s5496
MRMRIKIMIKIVTFFIVFLSFGLFGNRKPIEMMDREIAYIPRCQLGFMNFVCTPAYEAIVSLIPGMQPLLDGIMVNKVRWEDIKAKGDAEREKAKREADEKKPIFIPS